jgi:RNA polymerase sigma-32 factor
MASVFDGASLQSYRANLGAFTPLDRETERELAVRWREGDQEAGRRIVEACLPFVVSVALEYRRWGVPMEDIVQQGNLGLLRAAAKFEPDRDVRLATYAAYWIRAEIREYVVRAYRVVRLGTTKAERRALRAYRTTHESDPRKLAELSGLSEERVRMLLPLLAARETSLDGTASGEGASPMDRIASPSPTPEDEAGAAEHQAHAEVAVRAALRRLSERERLIVRERVMTDEPLTLAALGEMLGVSKERVRQLEERAMAKLRAELSREPMLRVA